MMDRPSRQLNFLTAMAGGGREGGKVSGIQFIYCCDESISNNWSTIPSYSVPSLSPDPADGMFDPHPHRVDIRTDWNSGTVYPQRTQCHPDVSRISPGFNSVQWRQLVWLEPKTEDDEDDGERGVAYHIRSESYSQPWHTHTHTHTHRGEGGGKYEYLKDPFVTRRAGCLVFGTGVLRSPWFPWRRPDSRFLRLRHSFDDASSASETINPSDSTNQ